MKILLIEDEVSVAKLLAKALAVHSYSVEIATDGQIGLQLAQTGHFTVIVIDMAILKLDGINFCRQLRAAGYQIPILLLESKTNSSDRIRGLEAGADDCVAKPFNLAELVARIRSLVRRGQAIANDILTWGQLRVNLKTGCVMYGEKLVQLTRKEYSLLELFMRHPERIYSRSAILDCIWLDKFPLEESVTAQIKGLRQKLKAAGIKENLIETVYGMGYRLKKPPQSITEVTFTQAQAEVMAVVAQMWADYLPTFKEKLVLFEEVLAQLATGTVDKYLQQQAIAVAHKLAGSLGSYGLSEGSQIALRIELLLQKSTVLDSQAIANLRELVTVLQTISQQRPAIPSVRSVSTSPKELLIIDDDKVFAERIKVEAVAWGLQVEIVTSLSTARKLLNQYSPNIILLDLSFPNENGFTLLAELAQKKSNIPVLVLTAHQDLNNRVEAARLGALSFLNKTMSSTSVIKAVLAVLDSHSISSAKVMVVDDDLRVLAHLRSLLSQRKLQVITLQDTKLFWDVLETTSPDLLILDMEMPNFNGRDLCKVVRNDPRWSHLPVLFLSAHTDIETIVQGYIVGADDYITKPIIEPELLARVFNRLERMQNGQKLAV